MTRRTLYPLIAALALVAAACTASGSEDAGGTTTTTEEGGTTTTTEDGSDPDREQEYRDALAISFLNDETVTLTSDEADCMAAELLDGVGVERFEDAGFEPVDVEDDFNPFEDLGYEGDELQDLIATFFGGVSACGIDLVAIFADEFVDDELFVAADRDCLEDTMTIDFVERLVVLGADLEQVGGGFGDPDLTPDPELVSELVELIVGCSSQIRSALVQPTVGRPLTTAEVACLDAELSDDLIRDIFTAAFAAGEGFNLEDDPELFRSLSAVLLACPTLFES